MNYFQFLLKINTHKTYITILFNGITLYYLNYNVIKSVNKKKEKEKKGSERWCDVIQRRRRRMHAIRCRFEILKQKKRREVLQVRMQYASVCMHLSSPRLQWTKQCLLKATTSVHSCCACMEGRATRFTLSLSLSLSLSYGPTSTLTYTLFSSSLRKNM